MIRSESLLHIISVSFAVGLAYIAMDRFRFTRRAKEMLLHAISEFEQKIKEIDPGKQDSALTRLRRKLKDITDNGLGVRIFCKWGMKTFGVGKKSGWDTRLILCILFLDFTSLCLCVLFHEWINIPLSYGIFGIAAVGIVAPALLILRGNRHISITEAFICEICDDIEHEYNIKIDEFKEKISQI